MTIALPVSSIQAPQHLFVPYSNPGFEGVVEPELLIIHTGFLTFNFAGAGEVARERVKTFVPYNNGLVQNFLGFPQPVNAVVAASLSAWHVTPHDDALGALDSATVRVETQGDEVHDPAVLVMTANVAALHAEVIRLSYQVTVRLKPAIDSEGVPAGAALVKVMKLQSAFNPGANVPEE